MVIGVVGWDEEAGIDLLHVKLDRRGEKNPQQNSRPQPHEELLQTNLVLEDRGRKKKKIPHGRLTYDSRREVCEQG